MLIIVNQQKNLFKSIKNIDELEIYQEELEIETVIQDGYRVAKPIYGDWLIKVNNKIYARYSRSEEKDYIIEQLINAMNYNKNVFVFPVYIQTKTLGLIKV